MKKLILTLLLAMGGFCSSFGQNPTIVYGTNGVRTYPTNQHAGKVTVGLNTNLTGFAANTGLQWNGSAFVWVASGSPTLNATNSNILFTPDGLTFKGTNAFNISFLGGTNSIITNGLGGTMSFFANGYGWNTNANKATADFLFKGSNSNGKITLHSQNGTMFATLSAQNSIDAGIQFGNLVGGNSLNVLYTSGSGATFDCVGVGMDFGVRAGNQMRFGIGSPIQPYLRLTNSTVWHDVNVSGASTNFLTNFANVFNRAYRFDASEHVVDVGNANTLFINVGQWKNGGGR